MKKIVFASALALTLAGAVLTTDVFGTRLIRFVRKQLMKVW